MLRTTLVGLAAAAPLLLAGAAGAAPVVFDFETDPLGQATPYSSTVGALTATFSGPSSVDPDAFEISYNSASGPFPAPYATLSGAFLTTGNAFGATGSPLTIQFSLPVQSISLRFGLGDGVSLTLTTDTGGSAQAAGVVGGGFAYAEGTLAYTGTAFKTVILSTDAISLAIDDVAATAVPEPASALLLGAGLLGLAGVRRARS